MKQIKRTLLSCLLLLATLCAFTLSFPVLAEESTVTFTDGKLLAFAPGSSQSATDLFDGFKGVMPGDVKTEEITVTNACPDFDYIKVYLRALPHSEENLPVTGQDVASMNDFLSRLGLRVWKGEDLIFDASPDQAGGLAGNVYLGDLGKDQSLTLRAELTVPITLDNSYMNRLGEVDWIFTVEGFDVDKLAVRKVWSGDTASLPESVTVHLLKDGEIAATQTLSAQNQWAFTFEDLDQDHTWTVVEDAVPGWETSYITEGNQITVVNHKEPVIPPPDIPDKALTVNKVWDDTSPANRPDSVTVNLYNGESFVESVTLSADNDWSHTWEALDGNGAWQVIETNIPGGYVPSYSTEGDTVTITNTATLIQTGMIDLPILLLAVGGCALIGYGAYLIIQKKKASRAQA